MINILTFYLYTNKIYTQKMRQQTFLYFSHTEKWWECGWHGDDNDDDENEHLSNILIYFILA